MIARVTFMILFVLFTFNLLFSSTDDIVIYNDSLKIKAEQNDPESQFLLGRCLVGGFGIKKNLELGIRYMEKASDSGYIKAKTALGAFYLGKENATDKDKKKGIALLQTALKAGDAEAGSVLGVFKVYGLADIAISQDEAIALIKNAAQQNNLNAKLVLGMLYMEGTVVRKDEVEALTWYKDAAESGNPTAFSMLGEYYQSKNQFEEALYWSYLAKEMGIFGSEQYYSMLNSNTKLMNKEAISKRAEEWLDYNVKYCDVVTYPSHFEQSENLPAHWIEVQVKPNQNSDVTNSLKTIAVCDHEVTVYEWEKYMRACPSGIHNLYPVEVTSLAEIFKYCNLKSMAENLDPCYVYEQIGSDPNNWPESIDIKLFTNLPNNNGYRLPTEIEWNSAATGKKVDETFVYSGSNSIDEVAWCASNKANSVTYDTSSGAGIYTEKTKPYKEDLKLHRVCLKKSNSYSLFDMSGNAKEWCLDPSPDFPNSILVLKGGSYLEDKSKCSIEAKEIMSLAHEQTNMKGTGIRLVRTLDH